MNIHTQIRHCILDKLKQTVGESVVFFDGLPALIEEGDIPAIAVYLTDAQYQGEMLDQNDWQAVLHMAVFLPAQATDEELDTWVENRILPVLSDEAALSQVIDTMVAHGYEYQRDSDATLWSMAELTYRITYSM